MSLIRATNIGDSRAVESFLENGGNVDVRYGLDDRTPLMLASMRGHLEIVNLLISAGADVNDRSHSAVSCLMIAARFGTTLILEALIRAGAEVNARDRNGLSPLMESVFNGIPIVRVLLAAGADPTMSSINYRSARALARQHSKTDVEEVLAQAMRCKAHVSHHGLMCASRDSILDVTPLHLRPQLAQLPLPQPLVRYIMKEDII